MMDDLRLLIGSFIVMAIIMMGALIYYNVRDERNEDELS
jgi:hypothetical protein